MNGPWDDFKKPVATGPWSDFKSTAPDESSAESKRLSAHPAPPPGPEKYIPLSYRIGDVMSSPDNVPQSLGRGVLRSGARLMDAIAQFSPDYDPETVTKLEDLVPRARNNWDTAGQVATDIGLGAAPVLKGGQVLAKTLGALGRAAPVVADVAANAAWAGATNPDDKVVAALYGGTGAAGGLVLTKALSGMSTHVLPRYRPPPGLELTDAVPTVGIAAKTVPWNAGNRLLVEGEKRLGNIPFARAGLAKARERYNLELADAKLKHVLDETDSINLEEGLVGPGVRYDRVKDLASVEIPGPTSKAHPLGGIGLAISAFAHLPATVIVTTGMIGAYSQTIQKAMLASMKKNDTLATWLEREPKFHRLIELGASRLAQPDQEE